ncbi:MAG: plastocyanin/azurin family copper-binding protein [Thermoleophilaceae bacterium]
MRRRTTGAMLALAGLLASAPALAADHTYSAGPAPLQYESASITIDQGDTVTFQNLDSTGARHDVTSDAAGSDGKKLFRSAVLDAKATGPVNGVEFLSAGDYTFFCSVHPDVMKGTLHVTTNGTPKPRGAPGEDSTAPAATVSILDGRIAPVVKRGTLRVGLKSDEPARFKLVAVSGKTTLAKATVALKRKTRTVKIPLTRAGKRFLARAKKAKIKLKAAVNDAANNQTAATATRTLKR